MDCQLVIILAQGLNGNGALMSQLNTDCCLVSGITCVDNRVTKILWGSKGFTGYINGSSLPSGLLELNLNHNSITGTILDLFSTIPSLTKIDVSYNSQLSGSVPEMGNNITSLIMNECNLSGVLPKLSDSLIYADLGANFFTGGLQPFPSGLQSITLHHTYINGSLPAFPNSLNWLSVDKTFMSGPIPVIPDAMQSLFLGYDQNYGQAFTGSITMKKPRHFFINNNLITSVYIWDQSIINGCQLNNNPLLNHPSIANLTSCSKTGLFSPTATLTGTAMATATPTSLLSDCVLLKTFAQGLNANGALITSMNTCCSASGVTCTNSRVTAINWSSRSLTGYINGTSLPSELVTLNLQSNDIVGTISNLFVNLQKIQTIILRYNLRLGGTVPTLPDSLRIVQLNQCAFVGTLPPFPVNAIEIDLGKNNVDGPIPSPLPVSLVTLALPHTNINGTLPILPMSMDWLQVDKTFLKGAVPNLNNIRYCYLGYAGNYGQAFSGSVRINKPVEFMIQNNLITNVYILDTRQLTACFLDNNPLLGSPSISNLTSCTKNNLYSPSASLLPLTSTSQLDVTTIEGLSTVQSQYIVSGGLSTTLTPSSTTSESTKVNNLATSTTSIIKSGSKIVKLVSTRANNTVVKHTSQLYSSVYSTELTTTTINNQIPTIINSTAQLYNLTLSSMFRLLIDTFLLSQVMQLFIKRVMKWKKEAKKKDTNLSVSFINQ